MSQSSCVKTCAPYPIRHHPELKPTVDHAQMQKAQALDFLCGKWDNELKWPQPEGFEECCCGSDHHQTKWF